MSWRVQFKPEERNDYERNEGGMIISVTNGSVTQEVTRVAFVRRNSKNPKNTYEKQLKHEVGKARTSCELLNEQLSGIGTLA